MATGAVGNVVTTKRTKFFPVSGAITNDVIYTCPAGTYADVYLSDIYSGGGVFSLQSIKVVSTGGAVPNVKSIIPAISVSNQNLNFTFINAFLGTAPANGSAFVANDSFGTHLADATYVPQDTTAGGGNPGNVYATGSVIRLFPGDYIAADYTGVSAAATMSYSTVEVSSST